jgi:hypothetical protein
VSHTQNGQVDYLMIIFALYCRLFVALASDKSSAVPYSRDVADNRRKYGDNMLKKGDEHLATQRQYESESKAKIDAARPKRHEERDRLEALEVNFLILSWLKSGGWQGCKP